MEDNCEYIMDIYLFVPLSMRICMKINEELRKMLKNGQKYRFFGDMRFEIDFWNEKNQCS